jgi:hypothetical protein
MVWSDKHKIIFVHIPKTGGTSIEKSLNALNNESGYGIKNNKAVQHYTWYDYKKYMNNKFNKYYKFTIVRNPYKKVVSDYFYLKNIQKLNVDNFQNKTFDEYLDYCEFIVKNNLFNKTKHHDHFMPQNKFIYKDDNVLMIDKILKFENFEYIKKFMKLKYNVNINHENKNNSKKDIILRDEQKDKIYKIYEKDFILLNYLK